MITRVIVHIHHDKVNSPTHFIHHPFHQHALGGKGWEEQVPNECQWVDVSEQVPMAERKWVDCQIWWCCLLQGYKVILSGLCLLRQLLINTMYRRIYDTGVNIHCIHINKAFKRHLKRRNSRHSSKLQSHPWGMFMEVGACVENL